MVRIESICYLNGELLPLEQAGVSVLDRGFLFGDAVYELVPVYDGAPFFLDRHYRRLARSLEAIRLDNPLSADSLARLSRELVARNGGGNLALYLQISRGAAPERNHLFPTELKPTVFAMVAPMPPPKPAVLQQGIAVVLVEDIRWRRCDIKATSLLANVLLRQGAEDADAAEAIMVKGDRVTEGSSSSVFAVRDSAVMTPPNSEDILPGVTRDLVLEIARGHGIEAVEREIAPDQLSAADEVWITSSAREVLPVTRINGNPVGPGLPGPIWQTVYGLFQRLKSRSP